ncbi:Uncharacterised protein [Phocoenobacter uteri]|uniref:Uncharacterized protein n=1 Tax=Phocoenobacter uteri TaxID=146806 RepID=A0A379DEL4_9PAST|nr:hypothetical protein [Phocoenobacter uteri]SUB76428.1 Uncharacterised protein [Phocoenobacter uteri]
MKKFLIKLLGGVSKEEHQSILDYFQSRMINPQNLDFASSLMKRWNEFRCSINYMYKEICINNADFFTNNSSLLHDLVLQDYYFRRLYLLQNGKDFFDNVEEHEKLFFLNKGSL